MNRLSFLLIGFLLVFFSNEVGSQTAFQKLNRIEDDHEFSAELLKNFEKLNSKERFDLSSMLLDDLIANKIGRIRILNDVYRNFSQSKDELVLVKLINGCFLYRQGEIDSAILYLSSSSADLSELNQFQLSSESYNELGNAYFTGGRFEEAVNSYLNSLKIGHESDDETAKFNAFLGLGRSYLAVGDTIIGVKLISEYLTRAEQFSKFEAASDACGALAVVFQDIGDVQMATYYYQKGYLYSLKSNSKSMKANSLTNKAILEFNKGNLDTSHLLFVQALRIRISLGSKRPIVDSYFNLASFEILRKNYSIAKNYLDTALIISKNANLTVEEIDLVELLLETYKLERDKLNESLTLERLKMLKIEQEHRNHIDPLTTGVVSLMLDSNNTLPVSVKGSGNDWWFRSIAVFSVLFFSFVSIKVTRKSS